MKCLLNTKSIGLVCRLTLSFKSGFFCLRLCLSGTIFPSIFSYGTNLNNRCSLLGVLCNWLVHLISLFSTPKFINNPSRKGKFSKQGQEK